MRDIFFAIIVFFILFKILTKKEHMANSDVFNMLNLVILIVLVTMITAVCLFGPEGACLFSAFNNLFI
jgi:hypothetical protein